MISKRTWAEINLDHIKHNAETIKNKLSSETEIMGVIKADAYGHGALYVAKCLLKTGIRYFAVSNIEEAIQLRQGGISVPVLILGYTPPELARALIEYRLVQSIFSYAYAKQISEHLPAGEKLKCHLKLDTGMSRLGFTENNFSEIDSLQALCNLEFEGVYTHFACADKPESAYTEIQFKRFLSNLDQLKKKGFSFRYRHCCNSGGILNFPEMQLNMVRPGIILYGLYPDGIPRTEDGLRPAMTLRSVISQVKWVEADTPLSYGGTFVTNQKVRIATISIGYADGYPRVLSNRACVLVAGKRAPLVGRICMDQCLVDVTGIPEAKAGDTVTIFGTDGEVTLPVEEIAEKTATIHYETVCLIGKRVPRVYYENGKETGICNYILQ